MIINYVDNQWLSNSNYISVIMKKAFSMNFKILQLYDYCNFFHGSCLLPTNTMNVQYNKRNSNYLIHFPSALTTPLIGPNINKCMYTIYDEKRCSSNTTDSCMYVYPHSKRILDNPSYALLSQRAIKLSSPSIQLEMNLHYWWIKGLVAFNIKGRRRPFSLVDWWFLVLDFLYSNI